MRIKVGILGATGYVGSELLKILLKHPHVEVIYLGAKLEKCTKIEDIFPQFKGVVSLLCHPFNAPEDVPQKVECLFLALPHGVSMELFPSILEGRKVIDLSADFRLPKEVYEKFYKKEHNVPQLLDSAVYGLAEIFAGKIKDAELVAVPGCYPTATILALFPALKEGVIAPSIFVDAKSGVSGAGRAPSLRTHFPEANENILPYNVISHRHRPEIEECLQRVCGRSVRVTFVPHLLPLNRGLMVSCFASLLKDADINKIYSDYYREAAFVRLQRNCCIKDVVNSNFCDISIYIHKEAESVVFLAALDNLVKGAAGQAVQCMNIMYGCDECTGLL